MKSLSPRNKHVLSAIKPVSKPSNLENLFQNKTIKCWLPGRSVSSKALDEEGHCDDKANAHEEDAIPIGLRRTNARGVSKQISFAIPKKRMFSEQISFKPSLTVTHWAMVRRVSWLSRRFFSRTRGPSASTFEFKLQLRPFWMSRSPVCTWERHRSSLGSYHRAPQPSSSDPSSGFYLPPAKDIRVGYT